VIRLWLVLAWLCVLFSIVCFSVPLCAASAEVERRLLAVYRAAMPRQLLRLLGIRVRSRGQPPEGPCLIVSNHLGWIDALAYCSLATPVFVALSRSWPVISFMMRAFGTIFVERDDITVLHAANRALAHANGEGQRTMVFPEGNSSWGWAVMPFKAPLFQSAIDAGVPVYAASIRCETPRPWPEASRVACWTDFTPFLVHAARAACLPWIEVTISWSARPLSAPTRKELAALAYEELLRIFTPTT
jgi:1-acyl-sn-glycerol-3-phosphate acyltransferase